MPREAEVGIPESHSKLEATWTTTKYPTTQHLALAATMCTQWWLWTMKLHTGLGNRTL